MSCLNPVTILLNKGSESEHYQRVRCRKCEDCKQSMRSAAFVRLKAEYEYCMKNHGMCFFFTLTFADEYVPFKFHRMCFDKRLVQDWIQSFRQDLRRKYGYQLKYFLVSELGHVGTHRPHHHGLFFLYPNTKYQLKSWKEGINKNKIPFFPHSFARLIQSYWKYGRCDISEFDSSKGGIQYVAKYISKFDEEEKLFKDIITRIQIKRGKGNPDKSVYYYSAVFPSLHAFMQRYCPFTMISQGLGSSLNVCDDCLIAQKPLFYEGFQYSIPRYYSDRYIRKEIKAAQEFVIHDSDFSDCGNFLARVIRKDCPSFRKIENDMVSYLQPIFRDEVHPSDCPLIINQKPSEKVCKKYKHFKDDMFTFEFGPMPFYDKVVKDDGKVVYKQVLPKQSEVSQLSSLRASYHYFHILDDIENKYFALPTILQDSCSFDVPQILKDCPCLERDSDFVFFLTNEGLNLLSELDDLSRVASEWRARSRLDKMEQKRKEKMQRNVRNCKKPLSWNEYRDKSQYLLISKKFKT